MSVPLAIQKEWASIGTTLLTRQKQNRMRLYYPDHDLVDENGVKFPARSKYPKHMEFFRRGANTFSRMFLAAVGAGKTECLIYELTCHARNWYPHWWEGVRYARPLDIWVSGGTARSVRDIIQTKWLGSPKLEEFGGGMLPVDWLDLESISRMSQGSIDSFRIKCANGKESNIGFKTYEQGVAAFYGTDKDIVAFDEPCPVAIYAQGLMRTRNRENARSMYTVAALEGRTETVALFMDEPDESRVIVTCNWSEIPHLTEKWKRDQLANTPEYLRESVQTGVPTRGAGAVYPVKEETFVIEPIKIPSHWRWIWGLDGGFHNTAAGWYAYDKDKDVLYLVSDYKAGGPGTNLGVHAAQFIATNKALGFEKMPGVGDAAAIDQTDGKKLLDEYKKYNLNLRLATKDVDVGVGKVLARLEQGRFKVFNTCVKWLEEFRKYSYKLDEEGGASKIVKLNDHLMDQTRYVCMDVEKVADHPKKTGVQLRLT